MRRSRPLPQSFFERLARQLSDGLGLAGTVIWMLDAPGSFQVFTEIGLERVCPANQPALISRNQTILAETLASLSANCLDFHDLENHMCDSVLSVPVQRHGQCVAIIQLFGFRSNLDVNQSDNRQAAESLESSVTEYLVQAEEQATAAPWSEFFAEYRQLCESLHRTLDLQVVANTAVNDALLLLDVDRVSLLIRAGHRWKLTAVSGQSRINRRTQHVRRLESLTSRALSTGAPLRFNGSDDRIPTQLRKPLAEYLEDSQCRMVHVIPLLANEQPTSGSRADRPTRATMALVVEQFRDSQPSARYVERCEDYFRQVAIATANARRLARVPFKSILAPSSATTAALPGRRALLAMLMTVSLVASCASLFLVKLPYRVEASGRLIPSGQQRVFAPSSGTIESVFVQDGDRVVEGQRLFRINDPHLEAQLIELRSRLTSRSRELHGLRTQWHQAKQSGSNVELLELQSRQEQAQIALDGLKEQIRHAERSADKLEITSPFAGVIVLARPANELKGRPVERGDMLLELFDTDSEWILDVAFEETRFGHVKAAVARSEDRQVPASYVLRSNPSKKYSGRLISIADHTSSNSGEIPVVRAVVATDQVNPGHLHLGADVLVRINCGNRIAGYVLFGDVVEAIQRVIWF